MNMKERSTFRSGGSPLFVLGQERPPVAHLYIHVPFCVRKCVYCAFASRPITSEAENIYLDALEKELRAVRSRLLPRTVFIGGGTPSCLSIAGLERLMGLVQELDLSRLEEFSVEMNPATVDQCKARVFKTGGVNRVSLGAQSFNNDILKQLGRIHTAAQVTETYDLLRSEGFEHISLDIIFAVPGQTLDDLNTTLEALIALRSEHLSCYEMTYEEGTPLTAWVRRTGFRPDEALSCRMYDTLLERLEQEGLVRYEISNFARPGRECMHNIAYWRGADYYGAGPAACSLLDGVRYSHPRDLTDYSRSICATQQNKSGLCWEGWEADQISPLARAGEIAGVGLRLSRGWRFDEFYQATGFRLEEQWPEEMERICLRGDGEFFEGGFRLNRKGLRFADLAAEDFIKLEDEDYSL